MSRALYLVSAAGLWLALCVPLSAQEPEAFTLVSGESAPPSFLTAERHQEIAVHFDLLGTAPQRIALPLLDGARYVAERTGFERRGPDDFTWQGRLVNGDGSVTLTVSGSALAGRIEAPGANYGIFPRDRGTASLILLDPERFQQSGTSAAEAAKAAPAAPSTPEIFSAASRPDAQSRIDVLVLYTPLVRNVFGDGIKAIAQSAIDTANAAFANSQITTRLRLVHTREIAIEEGYYDETLIRLKSDPTVARLRNAYRADLVDLLVLNVNVCGVADLITNLNPDPSKAFSLTRVSCVTDLTFAHELGHNLGAHHDPANAGFARVFPFALGHYAVGEFRTVMSYSSECGGDFGCPRISHFSNPNVLHSGHPTGIANDRDNHRTLNGTDAIVANYRQEAGASDFHTVEPCRVIDTRSGSPLSSGIERIFPIAGSCEIPADATSVAVNITVADPTAAGYLRLYPGNFVRPETSSINFIAGVVRSNNAMVPLATDGSGSLAVEPFVISAGSVHMIVDVFGYYALPTEDTWIPQEPLPRGRSRVASAVTGDRIYVIGGQLDSGELMRTVESFDPATGLWRTECPMPTARAFLSAAAVAGRIYAFGGQGTPGSSAELTVVEEFDPAAPDCSTAWTTKSPMPAGRSQATAAVTGGKVYLIGGAATPQSLHEYDPALDAWTPRTSLPSARIGAAAAAVNGTIYVLGGGTGPAAGDLLVYDPETGAWSTRAPMPISSTQLTAAVLDGRIYAVGGDTAVTQEYDPATDTWLEREYLPTHRGTAAAGVLNGRMHVIGGAGATGILDAHEMYIPPATSSP